MIIEQLHSADVPGAMDMVSEWLAPTVLRDLSRALDWRESRVDGEQTSKSTGQSSCYDRGDALRVPSEHSGVVQIIKAG